MPEHPALELPDAPKLTHNITHFARALRRAGLPIGPGRVVDAIQAVEATGFTSRDDFFFTLRSCFITRPDHRQVFAQVFRLFWRDPRYMDHMMSLMLPSIRGTQDERMAKPAEKRAAEALLDGAAPEAPAHGDDEGAEAEITVDASATTSVRERLRQLDFEQMSVSEIADAKRMLSRLRLPVSPIVTRRSRPDHRGQTPDWRATLRSAGRRGGDIQRISMRKPATRWPNLVVLCDISGSMSQYSRMVLHFLHAVSNHKGAGWSRVYGFTFGTRLTNITQHLRTRDVDAALAAAGAQAQDWEGGTRIGDCLRVFNRDWSRRVMGQGAVVLLITDGLDRGDADALSKACERLRLSARRLIWINPLLRWESFAPRAGGIRAMLPHVDAFCAGHSIASLEDLANVVSDLRATGEKTRLVKMMQSQGSPAP